MVNLADIDKFFTESDKIKHLVKYLEGVDELIKRQEEMITSLSNHVSSHDLHLESHDKHLHTHDQRFDRLK